MNQKHYNVPTYFEKNTNQISTSILMLFKLNNYHSFILKPFFIINLTCLNINLKYRCVSYELYERKKIIMHY